jgi:hypothetical protein
MVGCLSYFLVGMVVADEIQPYLLAFSTKYPKGVQEKMTYVS